MRCFEKPTERDFKFVRNYILNEKPIVAGEEGWIHLRDDLVALRPPKEPDWLEGQIVRLLHLLDSRLTRVSRK